jgi:ribonucleoside-diphosphate reductase alpha chain
MFEDVRPLDDVAINILNKRYFHPGETKWDESAARVVDWVVGSSENAATIYKMIRNRYFLPNSPTIVNAGKPGGGLSACFVVDFPDTIEGIYKTKLDFALIARKGGGCGTTLSHIRPEGDPVSGSTHGYAGGPIKFFDTICHDMEAITQAGFRDMAMMGVMSVFHPDILKFIRAKLVEGKMSTTNISVVVDNAFMKAVENDETYWTEFGGKRYQELRARDVFQMIVEGAWRNGEPGLLFKEKMNQSPYMFTGQVIDATNPCGEQPLPANGTCNLGSLDISKFLRPDGSRDDDLLEKAVRLSVQFLDAVIDATTFPTREITQFAMDNRPIGLGIMGFADYLLERHIAYGSPESLKELGDVMKLVYVAAKDESRNLGTIRGYPKQCLKLPVPRRNITLLSIAPTGTISLIAGCSSGIEPIFSEVTVRTDKTGTYNLVHPKADEPWFRCAVSSNGAREVTWQEHIEVQNAAGEYVDSGVSKTINCPNKTHKETVSDIFLEAWKKPYIKGITLYRNQSRKQEVLTPKNLKKDKCPVCGADLIQESGCKHCPECDFSVCEIG